VAATRLVPVATNLASMGEQIGRAAQRFEAAQTAAAKLSQDVAIAAQRFERVDHALAGACTKLSSAVEDFGRHIQRFVGDTNQDLAKAAQHVATMVRGLEETLEDFGLERRPN